MIPAQTVLHVDDDPSVLELSRASFRRAGDADVTVVTAASGPEGMAVLDSRRVDCIVSDSVAMPDGTPFVAAARRAHPAVSIVLFTAKEWDDVRSDAAAARVETYVRKADPGDFARVIAEARTLARRGRANEEEREPRPDGGEWEFVTAHDWETDDELSTSIVVALAAYTGRDADETGPLYPTVDADVLDALLRPPSDDCDYDVQVRFPYRSWEFTVSSRGEIGIRAARDGAADESYPNRA
ncbi:HalOD1 output domain-containing protein [Halopelagius fulvigenes]|uniref:HalOD1 output domain-containing protein n=1 Tax=Halopelagius fulvigenes TaxID=1198324 RepID=A0ABD5TVF9_9EURY